MDNPEKENNDFMKAFDEALHMLDNYEMPQPITVNIETEEDQKFWFWMRYFGYVKREAFASLFYCLLWWGIVVGKIW